MMKDVKTGIGEFAIRHPFITMFIISDLCATAVKLVRGYPAAPIRDLNINAGKSEEQEEPEEQSEVEIVPEENVTVEEA